MGIFIIAKMIMNWRDLVNTIQWSLLESPIGINKMARIIMPVAEEVKIF